MAFGKKCKDQEAFIKFEKEGSAAAAGFNISDLFPSSTLLPVVTGFNAKLEKLLGRYEKILGNIIEEHMAKKCQVMSVIVMLLKILWMSSDIMNEATGNFPYLFLTSKQSSWLVS